MYPKRSNVISPLPLAVLIGLWGVALFAGIRYLVEYEHTPGRSVVTSQHWPARGALAGDASLPTPVVALHPRCSCSRATLTELKEASSHFKRPYKALMLIYQPRGESYKWQNNNAYREAQQARHARVLLDDDGGTAASFGAFTSGEVLYYSATNENGAGRLPFSGGVTGARGMLGANAGLEALKVVANSPSQDETTPQFMVSAVFGCSLAAFRDTPRPKRAP